MSDKIVKKVENLPQLTAVKRTDKLIQRVAAYARVSTGKEEQQTSIVAQKEYYTDYIKSHAGWQFVGVYADEGISGCSTKRREQFKQLMSDCMAGKIDMVLTKSISRFGRNTVDTLTAIRELKSKGIGVYFEKEQVWTMDSKGEFIITLMSSLAQEESRSMSENILWAVRKRYAQGKGSFAYSRVLGLDKGKEKFEIVVNREEAVIVCKIFRMFIQGLTPHTIAIALTAAGIPSPGGCEVWSAATVRRMLSNEKYKGDMLLQKEFTVDFLTKKVKKNEGELPQYFVENTHEPIIDMETFRYVQDEIARRKELGALANKSLNTCCFTGKIKCPHCGVSYMHNKRTDRGNCLEFWCCGSRKKKGGRCGVGGSINHKNMVKACTEVLGLEEFDEEIFLREVAHIDVPKRYVLEFHMTDGRVITKDCPNTGHKDCWTAEYRAKTSAKRRKNGKNCKGSSCFTGKIKCKNCECNFRRATQPSATAENGKVNYWRCSEHSNGCQTAGLREDALIPLIADTLGMTEFDDALFRKTVEYISVLTDKDLEIHKKDGTVTAVIYTPPAPKRLPRTEEQKAHMRSLMKEKWTPERKVEMSERMKQMRKERGENWRKEK